MPFDLPADYKQVPERLADLKAIHPNARLRPVDESRPYWVETIGDKTFIAYAAACYRDETDPLPAIGVAWEPFPGRTPYTKDSELQNAETSAWGRAIVAALRSEAKAIASAEDVRNRRAEQEQPERTNRRSQGTVRQPPRPPQADPETGEIVSNAAATPKQLGMISAVFKDKGFPDDKLIRHSYVAAAIGREFGSTKELTKKEASIVIEALMAEESVVDGDGNPTLDMEAPY